MDPSEIARSRAELSWTFAGLIVAIDRIESLALRKALPGLSDESVALEARVVAYLEAAAPLPAASEEPTAEVLSALARRLKQAIAARNFDSVIRAAADLRGALVSHHDARAVAAATEADPQAALTP